MTEHEGLVRAPGVIEAHRPQVVSEKRKSEWPVAALLLGAIAALYAAVGLGVYELVTSVNWSLLAAAGLLVLIFNLVLVFALLARAFDLQRLQERGSRQLARPRD